MISSSDSNDLADRVPKYRFHYCSECDFVAPSSRLLSRHKAITHSNNPLSCPLCPFVTIYQTNLLRHRREVHGILGTKGNKTCKFCEFKAKDNETLIDHHMNKHKDILALAVERFGKEIFHATAFALTPNSNDYADGNNVSNAPVDGNGNSPDGSHARWQGDFNLNENDEESFSTNDTFLADTGNSNEHEGSTPAPTFDSAIEMSELDSSDGDICDVDYNSVDLSDIRPSLVEKIEVHVEQLCLIERLEITTFLSGVKDNPNHSLRFKCDSCPAEFNKNCSFQFHRTLHGYDGENSCELCDYSVDFVENLSVHQQLHFSNLE